MAGQAVSSRNQKAAFEARLKRINAGKQYEHADVVGHGTQKRFEARLARRPKRRRSFGELLMVLVAFLSGMIAVFGGRWLYVQLAQMPAMPESFASLEGRGMLIAVAVLAGIMTITFGLATRGRFQALALGCALMYFGEAAVAAAMPDLWAQMFSPDYAAEMVERGAAFRLVPSAG